MRIGRDFAQALYSVWLGGSKIVFFLWIDIQVI
jgi:hypothetical protein